MGSSAGVYTARAIATGEGKRLAFTPGYFPGFPHRLRGTNGNDMTIVGDYNLIAHFNGVTWRYFSEFSQQDHRLWSVDQKGEIVCAIGELIDPIHSKALVYRGRR